MASLEDRVKDLERRASSGARARIGLAVKADLLEKRLQKLEPAAAPPGVPAGKISEGSMVKIVRSKEGPRQHVGQVVEVVEKDPYDDGQWGLQIGDDVWYYPEKDLELVDESRFSGKTYRQIFDKGYDKGFDEGYAGGYDEGYDGAYDEGFDEGYGKGYDEGYDAGYDEGLAAGRGEKEALIDQLTDELTESREKAAELERLNNTQQETIRRLREQVDILQASHGSRGEVSKPAPEFKKGDLVKIVGPCVEDSSGRACHRGQVRVLTEKDETGWWKIAAFSSCRFPESSLELWSAS